MSLYPFVWKYTWQIVSHSYWCVTHPELLANHSLEYRPEFNEEWVIYERPYYSYSKHSSAHIERNQYWYQFLTMASMENTLHLWRLYFRLYKLFCMKSFHVPDILMPNDFFKFTNNLVNLLVCACLVSGYMLKYILPKHFRRHKIKFYFLGK